LKFKKYLNYIKHLKGRKAAGVKLSNRELEALNKFYGIKKQMANI